MKSEVATRLGTASRRHVDPYIQPRAKAPQFFLEQLIRERQRSRDHMFPADELLQRHADLLALGAAFDKPCALAT
jgi:hypothetical protein